MGNNFTMLKLANNAQSLKISIPKEDSQINGPFMTFKKKIKETNFLSVKGKPTVLENYFIYNIPQPPRSFRLYLQVYYFFFVFFWFLSRVISVGIRQNQRFFTWQGSFCLMVFLMFVELLQIFFWLLWLWTEQLL